ncbi:hypothetical protein [Lysinibacillus boronitolerans]|uniref:hypothetical protein n=1 Tax=Lysinibacillus boronitolerans TaxID=309788 RepID=UPI0028971F62|nr:hypothetical protein [Bacillus mobilis]
MTQNKQEKLAIQKEKILAQLSPYKKHINTAKEWDQMAKNENLPPSHTIIYYFRKWNHFKAELVNNIEKDESITKRKSRYIEIAKNHIEEFSKSADKWKSYAKINNLPSTNTYINNFGSWVNAQSQAGVSPKYIRTNAKRYNKDYLIKVAKENLSNFKNTSKWVRFAKEHNLPSQFAYIRVFGSMAEAKKAIGIIEIITRKNYTEEELIQIALENVTIFTTQEVWNNFARKHNLPRSRAFAHAFTSWKQAKQFIYKLSKEK